MIKKLKLCAKLTIRYCTDLINGTLFKFASKREQKIDFNETISIEQEIKPSETFENKVFNLSLASQKINEYCIFPNEIFSFWKIVGNPNYGFKKGRSLLNGQLKEEIGGGLCQVSGIIYNVSVIGGLQILERHNHSVDIYTEETRFTPLGLDATVVYGYKDLRIKNNFTFPIKFKLNISGNRIKADLLSTQEIEKRKLSFEQEQEDNYVTVKVFEENKRILNVSKYRKIKMSNN